MTLIAALIIALTIGGIYAHWHHRYQADQLVDAGMRQSEYLGVLQALGQIHEAIAAIELPPVDLTPLAYTTELSAALNARMDTLHRDMAILTTRVETGPGKRTLRVP